MNHRQWQATLRRQKFRNPHDSHRPTPNYAELRPGTFSAPVVRLSKWPKNVFFASNFIADKADAAAGPRRSQMEPSRGTEHRRPTSGESKKISSGSRGIREEAPATRMKKGNVGYRSNDSRGSLHQQSVRGSVKRDEHRNIVVDGQGESFLEESAYALLLLHSRYFGEVRHEEDIVCSLCKLCREAGWMGNPLRVCPDIDPLVLDELVMARLRQKQRCGVERRHPSVSNSHPKQHEDDGAFSFEDLYRMLAKIANLVYPREAKERLRGTRPGRAMQRLLVEGVLPLATDNRTRRWSPSPEVLYGRPALTALRMQRETLHQLYNKHGAGGFSRSSFLKMLTDLGVSPGSVSNQHAKSVFDDVVWNGLPDTEPSLSKRQSRGGRAIGGSGDNLMETRRCETLRSSLWENGGDRLCWSLYLEAMAALAVGAVGAETRDRTDSNCELPEETTACWYGNSRFPEGRASSHIGTIGTSSEGRYENDRPSGHGSAEYAFGREKARTRSPGYAMVEPAAGIALSPQYGRGFFHDSRKSLELMPTLQEGEVTHNHNHNQASSPQHQVTPQEREGSVDVTAVPSQSTSRYDAPSATLGWNHSTARHFDDSKNGGAPASDEQASGKIEYDYARSEDNKHYAVGDPLPGSPLERKVSVGHISVERTQRRYTNELSETTQRITPSNEELVRAGRSDESDHAMASASQPMLPRTEGEGNEAAPSERSGTTRGTSIASSTARALHAVVTKGREAAWHRPSHPRSVTRSRSPLSAGGEAKSGVRASEGGLDHLPNRHGVVANGSAEATWDPLAVCQASPAKGIGAKDVGALSPAPCHGGLPTALSSCALPAASGELGVTTFYKPVHMDLGLPKAEVATSTITNVVNIGVPPRLQSDQLESFTGSAGFDTRMQTSSGHKAVTNCDMVGMRDGRSRKALRKSAVGLAAARISTEEAGASKSCQENSSSRRSAQESVDRASNESRVRHETYTSDIRQQGFVRAMHADHFTMNVEAAGCSAGLFEELLGPRVIAVYSKYRKELLVCFQRYRSTGLDCQRPPVSCSQDTSGFVDDSGIRNFVGDFPVLRRWVQGDSILRLIVRASRERGWQRCGEEPVRHSTGLSYFGFLEVLTRMAFATYGEQPLDLKLLSLICALKVDDPKGIFTSCSTPS